MSEVEATFVIACNQSGLSRFRTKSKQSQCTAYHGTADGGGHFNSAASQIEGQDLMSIVNN